uniref:EF-hand domain-containing protein n=1 Tax=Neobodo designis TaxID=312471 RepID=A0A7S1QIE6_NEODS
MADRAESSMGDAEGFQGAFALLDVRGFGKIGLEAIFDFVSACPSPPSIEEVTRMYNEFDEDGSGDIDSGEFVGFIDELEKVTGYCAKEMIAFFERKQYEALFNLVDDDGGGTISCQELRVLVDALHAMLDLRLSSGDVRNLMKEYDSDELNFEAFYTLMKKITGHKSILLVVRAFKEAQRRSKEKLSSAIQRFESQGKDAKNSPAPQKPPPRVRQTSVQCPMCKEKDAELAFLRRRVAELEAEASAAAAASQNKPKTVENVEPRVRLGLRSIEMAVSAQSALPQVKVPALNSTESLRFVGVMDDTAHVDPSSMAANASRLADLADTTHKAQRQVAPVLDGPCDAAALLVKEKQALLQRVAAGEAIDAAGANEALSTIANFKMQVSVMAESLHWTVEAAAEARTALTSWAAALVPFCSRVRKYAGSIRDAEEITQRLLETSTMVLWYGAEVPSEIEIALERVADGGDLGFSEDDLERLREDLDGDAKRFSKEERTALLGLMRDTTYGVQTLGQALSSATKRDRGVGTAPLQAILPAEPLQRIMPEPRHAPQGNMTQGSRSRPARGRDVYVIRDTRAPAVDALLMRYLQSGVKVPGNFARLEPKEPRDRDRHFFQFGSRRVEIVMVEEALAVKVGGGFMYFEEFCDMYTELEVTRVNRSIARSPSPNVFAAASAAASPSRSASGVTHADPSGALASTAAPVRFSGRRDASVMSAEPLRLGSKSPGTRRAASPLPAF